MADIYISYSQNNQGAAREIRNALEGWGHTVWMDDPTVEFDRALAERLDSALREADLVVALLSPTSVKSRTVRREIALAKSLDKSIIPVLVEPLQTVQESGGAKYIDATTNLQAAISRLVKAVESRMAAMPARPPVPPEMEEEDEGRGRMTLLAAFMIVVVVIVVILGIALGGQRGPEVDSALLTQVQATNDAQATNAALVRVTANAQATTIALMEQTQTAAALEPTAAQPGAQASDTATPVSSPTRGASPAATQQQSPTATAQSTPLPAAKTVEPTEQEPASPTPLRTTPTVSLPTSTASLEGILPTATIDRSEAQGQNLLVNPGFESFAALGGDVPGEVAQGWTAWFLTGDNRPPYQAQPTYGAAGSNVDGIYGGINAQQYFTNFETHDAGLYQRVTGIAPGSTLYFGVYAYVWSSTYDDPDTSEEDGDVTFQVGIDPTGGADPESPNVVWSVPAQRYDSFSEYSITAVATGGDATVFVRSTVDFPVKNNYVFVDEALLFVIG